MSTIYCKNCGKNGHSYNSCHHPIISSGVLCLKLKNHSLSNLYQNYLFNIKNNIKISSDYKDLDDFLENNLFLIMVNRRISLNMIELLIGKYSLSNIDYLSKILSMITQYEMTLLKTKDFDYLWKYIWSDNKRLMTRYKKYYQVSKKKFKKIKYYIDRCGLPKHIETEWGIPKGRRKNKESNFDCANREFCEETGLTKIDYEILHIKPITEEYKSTNNVNYCHFYYFAELNNFDQELNIDESNKNQYYEIGDIKLISIKDAKNKLRDTQSEKLKILNNLKKTVKFLINY